MQRPVQGGDDVVGVLEPDREADQPVEAVALQLIGRREVFRDGAVMIHLRRQSVERQRVADDYRRGEDIGEMPRPIFIPRLRSG